MTFLRGRNILWLLVPATFVVAFLWDSSVEQRPDFIEADSNPDYFLVNTSTLEFNPQGEQTRQFTSEKTLYFKDLMQTKMENPKFEMLSSEKPWQVTANFAVNNELSEQLQLNGDVEARARSKTGNNISLTSEKLTVDIATQTAFTEEEVEFTDGVYRQTATGMNVNFRTHRIEFKSDVKAVSL